MPARKPELGVILSIFLPFLILFGIDRELLERNAVCRCQTRRWWLLTFRLGIFMYSAFQKREKGDEF